MDKFDNKNSSDQVNSTSLFKKEVEIDLLMKNADLKPYQQIKKINI